MELICSECDCRFSAPAETAAEDIVRHMTDDGPWYALAAGGCFRDMIHTALEHRGRIACPECGALVRVRIISKTSRERKRRISASRRSRFRLVLKLILLVSLAWPLAFATPLQAGDREIAILERADAALSQLQTRYGTPTVMALPINRLMRALLRNAQGVAIFPGMFKAAVGIGGRHGRGVLLLREADGSWGPPQFLTLSGASAGIQVGVERSNLILIFRTRSDLERLQKGKLTLGVEDVLAVGSIGRDVFFDTDACLKTALLSTISPSKGLFAGWSVGGNILRPDAAATAAYYQDQQNCLRNGGAMGATVPPSLRLQMKLAELSAPLPTH